MRGGKRVPTPLTCHKMRRESVSRNAILCHLLAQHRHIGRTVEPAFGMGLGGGVACGRFQYLIRLPCKLLEGHHGDFSLWQCAGQVGDHVTPRARRRGQRGDTWRIGQGMAAPHAINRHRRPPQILCTDTHDNAGNPPLKGGVEAGHPLPDGGEKRGRTKACPRCADHVFLTHQQPLCPCPFRLCRVQSHTAHRAALEVAAIHHPRCCKQSIKQPFAQHVRLPQGGPLGHEMPAVAPQIMLKTGGSSAMRTHVKDNIHKSNNAFAPRGHARQPGK